MSLDRTIVIRTERDALAACSLIMGNWSAMSRNETPMASRVYEYKRNATDEQRSLMWIRLGEIAEQMWVDGRQFSADVWHEHSKREFLPEEDGPSKMAKKNYRKWSHLPDGSRSLTGSTEGLTVAGKAEYITKLEAFGASNGVRFTATPSERWAA